LSYYIPLKHFLVYGFKASIYLEPKATCIKLVLIEANKEHATNKTNVQAI